MTANTRRGYRVSSTDIRRTDLSTAADLSATTRRCNARLPAAADSYAALIPATTSYPHTASPALIPSARITTTLIVAAFPPTAALTLSQRRVGCNDD